ncbi:protein-L-isoaspartate O-methyltransferase family protein [Geminicoccus flavidas]|uniref:protein-L-isoaspartate O-methyltransferase family protein n=1 Tax=Geminicoccus flavidas TaxID=2506407 RepID=UPI00135CC248|nr:methyltransferase domain-containing protein [Geminicoccus flavidas]
MPPKRRASLAEIRAFHAKMMAVASRSADPRLERAFELVPREAFLPPGPWQVMVNHTYIETPTADPVHLYQNILVALDPAKGINNGEPFLHAAWLGAVAPMNGDIICHIGAGSGYYTALLATLTLPDGRVHAFEIDENLAAQARTNLVPFEIASVTQGDATTLPLPAADLIYVNAGIAVPPISWLQALRPGGRMIFPWRPHEKVGLAIMMTRTGTGFAVKPLMPAWFIPCIGASDLDDCTRIPTGSEARAVRSAWLSADRSPDDSAVAIYRHVWFSTAVADPAAAR